MNKNLPVIDMELGTKLAGNKAELANELLTLFIQMLPNDFSAIQKTIETKDYESTLKRVHKLHGAVSYCGLPRLKQATADLEKVLKQSDADEIPTTFEVFSCEVKQVLERSLN